MKAELNKILTILYGSETGTAKELSDQIWRSSYRRNIPARSYQMDDYPFGDLTTEIILVFIVSTSEQGDMPPNMRITWRKLLMRQLSCDWLSEVRIAVLGLGDSSYPKFNYAGKKLYRRLLQLGAKPIIELGLADDQHLFGPETVFNEWSMRLWDEIYQSGIFPNAFPDERMTTPIKYHLEYCSETINRNDDDADFNDDNDADFNRFFPLEVSSNLRLTREEHFQDTRLITFDLNSAANHKKANPFIYKPGDVLMVHPENLADSIKLTINALNLSDDILDRKFRFVPNYSYLYPPPKWLLSEPTTLRDCFLRYFDLQAIPRRSFLRRLALLSKSTIEKERLEELVLAEGFDDYLEYCQRTRRTIAELLRDFPETSACITPELAIDILPQIIPRAFSIASSPNAHSGSIQILVARVFYKIKNMNEPRRGLCSNFLCSSLPKKLVLAKIRSGMFRIQNDESILFIGPGTGVAPFRSIVAERSWENGKMKEPNMLLFFGCRNRLADYYFEDEWPTFANLRIITAFSRDQEEKIYVQHRILENGPLVLQYLHDSECAMPKAIIASFEELIVKHTQKNAEEAKKFIENLQNNGRIQFETWS